MLSSNRLGREGRQARSVWMSVQQVSRRLDQPALLDRGFDEARKQRVRIEGFGFQLGVILHADEPRMVGDLDDLGQHAVGAYAGKAQAGVFEPALVMDVDL